MISIIKTIFAELWKSIKIKVFTTINSHVCSIFQTLKLSFFYIIIYNLWIDICNKWFFIVFFYFRVFEKIRYYFGNSSESIPMSFVLGFYVSLVVKRWWEQYKLLPWPDNLALFISAAIPGNVSDCNLFKFINFFFAYYIFKNILKYNLFNTNEFFEF